MEILIHTHYMTQFHLTRTFIWRRKARTADLFYTLWSGKTMFGHGKNTTPLPAIDIDEMAGHIKLIKNVGSNKVILT